MVAIEIRSTIRNSRNILCADTDGAESNYNTAFYKCLAKSDARPEKIGPRPRLRPRHEVLDQGSLFGVACLSIEKM